MEIWRDARGYEGFYQVSSFGRVKSLERIDRRKYIRPRITLKNKIEKTRYQKVHLSKDGKAKSLSVHRLVALAYIPKPEDCDIADYLDNNPSNNEVSNREWTTHKGNMQYATAQGRIHYCPPKFKKGIRK